ncbi:sugar kinase [Archaeoglobales archaeon]|nr:MAG: sugar kinase [Archaeoglobales archaeon]
MKLDVVTLGESMIQLNAKTIGPLETVREWEQHAAGAESNFAVGVVRMGLKAGWISRLGKDGFGRYIVQVIKENGVDVSQVKFDPSAPTGIYFIWHPKEGESVVKYYRKGSAASKLSPRDIKKRYIKNSRWLHLTGITPALSDSCSEACFKAIEYAHDFELKISFDVNWRKVLWRSVSEARKVFEKIAKEVDLVKIGIEGFNQIWRRSLSPKDACKFLSKRFNCEALVTKERDAYACSKNEVVHERAMKVKVVDPVGAGDAFLAGYVASRLKGYSMRESLRIANVIGATVCTRRGDIEAIPTWDEIQSKFNL